MPPATLDDLDRRVVGALQVDARASWRKIAAALGESERTVARRGAQLLQSRTVVVTALFVRGRTTLVRCRTVPGSGRMSATNLARRPDTSFVYICTGQHDCVAEIHCTQERMHALMLDELPGTPGLTSFELLPALRYYRIVDEWQPGLLDPAQVAHLRVHVPAPTLTDLDRGEVTPETWRIVAALVEDGRQTFDVLARAAGISESTARRRVEQLRAKGRLYIRAVVEPALLGLPVQAILWVRTAPSHVDRVGSQLSDSPHVRYAAALAGEFQLVVDVTVPTMADLHAFVTQSSIFESALAVETSIVVAPMKRSGVLAPALRG